MKSRVAVWASVGFLVACCWAIYAFVTPPDSFLMSLRQPLVRAGLYLSCPISYVGRHHPVQLWWVLLANAATYAVVGLIVEVFREKSSLRSVA